MLPRPLEELKQIARQDDWHQLLVGSDIRQILGEIERLRDREKTHLREAVRGWKGRIDRLDMLAGEIADTIGAEHLITLAKAAVAVIDQLIAAMDQTLQD